jgi:hypothetical protein
MIKNINNNKILYYNYKKFLNKNKNKNKNKKIKNLKININKKKVN